MLSVNILLLWHVTGFFDEFKSRGSGAESHGCFTCTHIKTCILNLFLIMDFGDSVMTDSLKFAGVSYGSLVESSC